MGVVGGLVYLATALGLVAPLGVFGLITANTVQNSFHALVLGWLLWRRLHGFGDRAVGWFVVKVAVAGALAALVAVLLREIVIAGIETDGRAGWATLLLATAGALLAYAALLTVLRVRELAEVARLGRRLSRRLRGGG